MNVPMFFKTIVDSMDYIKAFRRVAFIWILWLTTVTIFWAMDFAYVTEVDATGRALLIGAVLGPISLVQGWVLKIYSDGSMKQQEFNKGVSQNTQ